MGDRARAVASHGLLLPAGGTCDYPAESTVLYGTEYANGTMEGSFGAPDPGATSVLDRILAAVVSKIQLAGVGVGDTLPGVVKRKLPKKEDGVDAAYQVTVSGSELADKVKRIAFGSVYSVSYEVEITLITPTTDALTNLSAITAWRESTRALMMTPGTLASVSEVKRVEIVDGGPWFDRSALPLNYDFDQIVLSVLTYERRA